VLGFFFSIPFFLLVLILLFLLKGIYRPLLFSLSLLIFLLSFAFVYRPDNSPVFLWDCILNLLGAELLYEFIDEVLQLGPEVVS